MRKYIIVIVIMLYCIIDVVPAKAENYDKTIDYRYRLKCETNDYNEKTYISNFIQWVTDNDMEEFSNTETAIQVFTEYGDGTTNPTTMSSVNIVSTNNGDFMFKGHMVSGTSGFKKFKLHEMDVDYIYKYPTSTVDTDYTVTYTLDSDMGQNYNYVQVKVTGIQRSGDGTTYTDLDTQIYGTTLGSNGATKVFGDTTTVTGTNGYNYSGFNVRIKAYMWSGNSVLMTDNVYTLWNFTSSLDTITPDIDYGAQLDNINGTLGSIYSSITSGLSSVTTAITNLPTTIITGIKNLFIYDDWQEDVEDINSQVSVPFVTDITNSFTSIMSSFTSYSPYYQETLRCPNLLTSSPQYLFSVDLDLSRILGGTAIGNYKWIDLIRIATSFGSFAVYYSIIRKLLLKLGIDINDFVSPIIRKVGNV